MWLSVLCAEANTSLEEILILAKQRNANVSNATIHAHAQAAKRQLLAEPERRYAKLMGLLIVLHVMLASSSALRLE